MQNVWLFQARLDYDYDLATEISPGTVDDWELNQYRKIAAEGDTVILWQAGNEAGIYGFGRLGNAPTRD